MTKSPEELFERRKPFWIQRVSEILDIARMGQAPFLDRGAVEELFDVRKRQAIRIMHFIGGYHVGKAFVVGRPAVIAWLEEAIRTGHPSWAEAARERLELSIAEARALRDRHRKFIVSPDARQRRLEGLPQTIRLKPGELRIEFFGAEDLFRQLYELGQAMGNDYERFRRLAEGEDA
jgi:hypothetical protein